MSNNNPKCSNCNGQTKHIDNNEYECVYCGSIVDEFGDDVHEI